MALCLANTFRVRQVLFYFAEPHVSGLFWITNQLIFIRPPQKCVQARPGSGNMTYQRLPAPYNKLGHRARIGSKSSRLQRRPVRCSPDNQRRMVPKFEH